MFVLKKDPIVRWPIQIPQPTDDGNVNPIPVTVEYRLLPQARYDELKGSDAELLREVVVGWNDDAFGQEDESGRAVALPFSPEALNQLIEFAFVRTGLVQGYWQAVAGLEKN